MRKVQSRRITTFVLAVIGGSMALVACMVAVAALRSGSNDKPQLPKYGMPVPPSEVYVKSVERKNAPAVHADKAATSAVAVVCGDDPATADRYEARNDALRSIARRRDLARNDVALLMAYVGSTNDVLRTERAAAQKNDVLNLLRNQDPAPDGLAELLVGMLEADKISYPPVELDYCIQHLGALLGDVKETDLRDRIRAALVEAAGRKNLPYAGTALYSLAEERRGSAAHDAELKRLTLALCDPSANAAARIAAVQLAGQRGWREALPILRKTLAGSRRDAVVDMAAIGSIVLLGGPEDLPLLESMRTKGGVRLQPVVNAAIERIKERVGEQ